MAALITLLSKDVIDVTENDKTQQLHYCACNGKSSTDKMFISILTE